MKFEVWAVFLNERLTRVDQWLWAVQSKAMNYRHAFHAGNHGDVLKHVVLTRVLSYMTEKDSPLAVLDAHAGIGHYDFTGLEAFKTGEWRGGIGALLQNVPTGVEGELLEPYLKVVRRLNADGALRHYPGSPSIAQAMLRPGDRLLLNELHPEDCETLRARFPRVRVSEVDAAQAVKSALPFIEKRGVILIDPAFEVLDETLRVSRMVAQGLKRMAQTCFIIWYPVTSQNFADQFCEALELNGAKSALRAELLVREAIEGGGLAGSGVIVINPPWTLHDELNLLLPALRNVLQETAEASSQLTWMLESS